MPQPTGLGRSRAVVAAAAAAVLLAPGALLAPAVAAGDEPGPPETFDDGLWWYDAMRVEAAHEKTTGEGVTIALIDSPLDTSVAELRGADIRLRLDCRGDKARPLTGKGASHGTQQAALLVGNGRGNGPGGRGVKGIAPDATILAYDNDLEPQSESIQCETLGMRRFLRDAVEQGADIVSVASTWGPHILPAVQEAVERGVVVVAASGASDVNDTVFPADAIGVVSVSAVNERARPWGGHRIGGAPVISAPGAFIGAGGVYDGAWQSYAWSSGTSPATSITSGALALVKSRYPEATGNQLIQHLIHYPGGDRGYGWSQKYGFGILSLTKMLETSPTQWPDENPLGKRVAEALQRYPMSASSLVEGPARGEASAPDGTPSPAATDEAEGDPATADDGSATASADTDSATPGWVWGAGALVLLAATAMAVRGRRGRTAGEAGTSNDDGGE